MKEEFLVEVEIIVKCSSKECPRASSCYFTMAIDDPIDQKYKDYYTGNCDKYIEWGKWRTTKGVRNQ